MFCKTKITFLIAIHWKVAPEIIRNTIGECLLDKLHNHIRFFYGDIACGCGF